MTITAARSLRSVGGTRRLVSGRVRELGVLLAEWERSTRGELRVVLVLGEAGLGKTLLANELPPRNNAVSLELIAHPAAVQGMPPFGPWADALGLNTAGDPDTDRVCRVCGSGLRGLLALGCHCGHTHDLASCAQALRYHFVEWIPGLLARSSKDRPIIVVLDNAHHCHDVVWEMLLRLSQDFPASHVFVLATARPRELARNCMALEALQTLEHAARIRRVQLSPFGRDDVRELTADRLGRDRVPAALVDWLMARAQGNPRCTVSLLEELTERGVEVQAPFLDGVPAKLARWIRAELARLDTSARALAELLAVLGEPVDPDDIARIIETPAEDVALTLERLVRSGTVAEQQPDQFVRYLIAQPLVREVLYSDIGGARRRLMHRRVAVTLLESGRTETAAEHYVRAAQAGDGEAIVALIELARLARQRGLPSTAWRTVSNLQGLLPAGDKRWLTVVDALFPRTTGGPNGGIADQPEHFVVKIAEVQRIRRLLPWVGDLQRQAEVRLRLAGLFAYGAGDVQAGERECRQALALYQQAGRDHAARSAAIELAKMRGWAGDLRGQEVAARELVGEAERAGDQRGVAEALGVLGHSLGSQGRFDAAEDVLLRSIEMAPVGASSLRSQTLAVLATLDACRGHLVSARTRCAQAAASGSYDDPAIAQCGAFIELVAGDMTIAQAQQAAAHDPADRTSPPIRLAGRAAIAAAERGALPEARRNLSAMTRIECGALGILEPLYWWAQAAVAKGESRYSAAVAALQRAVERYTAMNAFSLMGFVLADLAEVAVLAGDSDAAGNAARWAEDSASRTAAPIHQTLHLLTTAFALIGRGHHEAAARAAFLAAEGFSSRGYVWQAARARVIYAHAVQRSDRRAAQEALHEAAAAFDACGATVRHQQARALLEQLGSSDGQCAAQRGCDPGSLTTRERQVAELAAGGYTAAQIATRLHIGVRTVETHLARSYPKLGVTGKQQLVHHAAELGFLPGP